MRVVEELNFLHHHTKCVEMELNVEIRNIARGLVRILESPGVANTVIIGIFEFVIFFL